MTFAQPTSIDKPQTRTVPSGTNIVLASVALLIVFAIAVCLASVSPGTAADEIAAMTTLP